jgi:hypothetical protein
VEIFCDDTLQALQLQTQNRLTPLNARITHETSRESAFINILVMMHSSEYATEEYAEYQII